MRATVLSLLAATFLFPPAGPARTAAPPAPAAGPASQPAPAPVGTWRGTSTCLVRPSACNDEAVVYRIARMAALDSLAMDARKIVAGAEVEMGVLACHHAAGSGTLACPIPPGVWRFAVRGDTLVGELRLTDGRKFRDVRAMRSPH